MRIAIYSNAPHAPTGYGTQTKQLAHRLVRDGHEVAILANYGLMGAPLVSEGAVIFPGGVTGYSTDIVDYQAKTHGAELVLSLYDVWPLLESGHDPFKEVPAAFWTPIDHDPVSPKVAEWAKTHDTVAMSEYGQQAFRAIGIEPKAYVPHALDLSVWKPTASDHRRSMQLPDDAFLVGIVAANIGVMPPRKAWHQQLIAWRVFAESHQDAYLYIHSQLQHPRGIDLARLIIRWGVPQDRLRVVDQGAYASGLLTQEDMARLYSAFDVTLNATMGEGFGLATLESQACGIPVIVTDFAASPELVGAGWKVPWEPEWDYGQDAYLARPSVQGIVAALEDAYAASHDTAQRDSLRASALVKAAEYDADKVYEERWKPLIASYQKPVRKGMSNAAKRRAKKAAA